MRNTDHRERGAARVILLLLLAVIALFLWWQLRGAPPQIRLTKELKGIGRSTPLSFTVTDRRGLRSLQVDLEQGGQRMAVLSESYGSRWAFWRSGPSEITREVLLGASQQNQLREGEAELRMEAHNRNWASSQTTLTRALPVRLRPPTLEVHTGLVYVNQGGCEMVLYRVSASAVSSGVRVGPYFFPGYPLPGGEAGEHLALFAVPYDLSTAAVPQVVAEDEAGNLALAGFPARILPKQFRRRDIELTDPFMQATVPAILAQTPELQDQGDLLKNFLTVNGSLRQKNRGKILELGRETVPEFLWEGSFLQLSNSAVESQFADYRRYLYKGQVVDQQVHLGFDLAAVAHTPVVAANAGRVLFAEYLGIFGNTLILDHGFGLQSLYAHLHSFQVKPGEAVRKGQLLGVSDSTGLAGGDHLHFTLLLAGVEVNPVEWWDPLWIEKHLLVRLPAPQQPATASR